ncbi:DUF4438 domain-containing protein [Lutispora saccharofermentans]|uniref:DUF4438 domain-containing protein n=1 Tax=Lutispora saccharofermentans TaxID=3024236 RepID=A0ABT1NJ68_9FIRM|nr:DUF4438 domain-containing protein [Lutispora saccharofermentans]MCQ1531268.1 DUF4438 domain-containing protein [Lutispora saccharofermentans]
MLKTNIDKLVMQSVQGKVHHPVSTFPYRISSVGEPMVLPATGGITYNVKVGDPAMGWAGDHVEPGVSIKNENDSENGALNLFSCIGNKAKIVSGDAKGATGYVTGMHGGVEHVLVYFEEEALEKMTVDDKILVKAWGQGLELLDYPQVKMMNIDPELFGKLGIEEKDGKLIVPVAAEAPAYLMGSGTGSVSAYRGDYDIMTSDADTIKEYDLDKLRFGDIVLLRDHDNSFGRTYLKGAVTIGVVIHSDCIKSGHGPGITAIMTCREPIIEGVISDKANIADYLGLYLGL